MASGGHTFLARVREHDGYETLGQTLDDAAGEAFDKGARMLGLGFPGGPALSKLAARGRPARLRLPDREEDGRPRLLLRRAQDRAALQAARGRSGDANKADLAASYERAIVDALLLRVERALVDEPEPRLAIGGGVAANRLLRERASALGVEVHVPPRELCTDNAAMIASAARYVEPQPFPQYLALDAYATKRAA